MGVPAQGFVMRQGRILGRNVRDAAAVLPYCLEGSIALCDAKFTPSTLFVLGDVKPVVDATLP